MGHSRTCWRERSAVEKLLVQGGGVSRSEDSKSVRESKNIPVGDSVTIRVNLGVTQNNICTNHTVSFPTLLNTLSASEGQWPGLVHPEFSAETLHLAGAWFAFFLGKYTFFFFF